MVGTPCPSPYNAVSLLRRDCRRPRRETPFHVPPRRDGIAVLDRDVGPAHNIAGRDVVPQRDLMGETDRQCLFRKTARGRDELAPNRVAALAVEHLAGVEVALGYGDDIAAPRLRLPGRLTAQGRGQYRYAEFQPDQMVGFVHRGIPAARVGL